MSLRTRIALIAAAAVAVSVLLVSVTVFLGTARTLHADVDRELRRQAGELVLRLDRPGGPGRGPARFGGPDLVVQILDPLGRVRSSPSVTLPVTPRARRVAGGQAGTVFETVRVQDVPVRVLTVRHPVGALQVARPIRDVEQALAGMRDTLVASAVAGVLLAAMLGTLVARRAVGPVHQLTELAEDVAATKDLSRRIAVAGDDELGRLARTFNTMLENLEQARDAQEQLVADASHELRTPLTSLRTNVEVLAHADRLDATARRDLVADVVAQLDEFGRLVAGLVELARGARPAGAAAPVRLEEIAARVVAAARTAPTAPDIRLDAEPSTVPGEEDRLERAIANLVDNAVKYGGPGPVEVEVRDGQVRVRDHGPGIPPEHLARVFERFYRAPEARSAPGSGLGLSIVRQVAEAHGGTVEAADAPDGGAVFTLRLPTTSPPPTTPPPTES